MARFFQKVENAALGAGFDELLVVLSAEEKNFEGCVLGHDPGIQLNWISAHTGIKAVTEGIAEEIEGEEGGGHEGSGSGQHPPVDFDGVDQAGTIGEEGAPAGLGGLDAEAEEAEEGFLEDD